MEQQPVSRVTLDVHPIGGTIPVDRVEVRRITIAPHVAPGAHWHNGPVFGVVESGSVHFQVETAAERILHAGDVFFEPADTTITTRFDATEEGVTFLAWFPLPDGVTPELAMGERSGPAN